MGVSQVGWGGYEFSIGVLEGGWGGYGFSMGVSKWDGVCLDFAQA